MFVLVNLVTSMVLLAGVGLVYGVVGTTNLAALAGPGARWVTVESEDKKRSRINVINDILTRIPWQSVEVPRIQIPQRPAATDDDYERPDRSGYVYAKDVAAKLEKVAPGKGGKGKKRK
jgi:hypothetical protein